MSGGRRDTSRAGARSRRRRRRGIAAPLLGAATLLAACAVAPLPKTGPYHPSDALVSVTRIVHGSYLLDFAGVRVLVDPWYFPRGLLSQREPLGLTPRSLPPIHAILITHGHGDHLDPKALDALGDRSIPVIVRRGLGDAVGGAGYSRVTELDWWETAEVADVTIHAVPADHTAAENGYVLQAKGVTAYAAGDTRYFSGLEEIARRFPHLDVAILPIGGLRLLGLSTEMGPREAARAVVILQPRRVIPVHYAATGLPLIHWTVRNATDKLRRALRDAGLEDRLVVLATGESWHYFGE
jgi:L-ascorbate metabolism protein UlaG (beta-lactamase superfamily)